MSNELSNKSTQKNDASEGRVEAINQVFAEFQLVYNNQYHKAFPTTDKLQYAKKIWYGYLKEYTPQQILDAAHSAIKESEFLPTVRGLLKYFENHLEQLGLPESRNAYMEACRAPNPKAEQQWSHPVVYHAGHESDWFFLASNVERITFPVFEKIYKKLCERALKGEVFKLPSLKALPEKPTQEMTQEEREKAVKKFRLETGL